MTTILEPETVSREEQEEEVPCETVIRSQSTGQLTPCSQPAFAKVRCEVVRGKAAHLLSRINICRDHLDKLLSNEMVCQHCDEPVELVIEDYYV